MSYETEKDKERQMIQRKIEIHETEIEREREREREKDRDRQIEIKSKCVIFFKLFHCSFLSLSLLRFLNRAKTINQARVESILEHVVNAKKLLRTLMKEKR